MRDLGIFSTIQVNFMVDKLTERNIKDCRSIGITKDEGRYSMNLLDGRGWWTSRYIKLKRKLS